MVKFKKNKDIREVYMSPSLMDSLFDASNKIGYENPEELKYKEVKKKYNKSILRRIKSLLTILPRKHSGEIEITTEQMEFIKFMFRDGLTLTKTCKKMKISVSRGQLLKKLIINKISKKIKYDFKFNDDKSL